MSDTAQSSSNSQSKQDSHNTPKTSQSCDSLSHCTPDTLIVGKVSESVKEMGIK